MKSDLEYGNYRMSGSGGSFYYNSTVALTKRFNAIAVHGSPVLQTLEDEDGDCLADYGFAGGETLTFGMLITSRRDKPFTKVKFSSAGVVLLYQE